MESSDKLIPFIYEGEENLNEVDQVVPNNDFMEQDFIPIFYEEEKKIPYELHDLMSSVLADI